MQPGRAGAVGAEVEVLLGVELRVVLEAAAPEAIGSEHERERGVEVVLAAAGEEVAVVEGEAQAGLAVLQQEALDGDGVGIVALHDCLHGGMGPDRVLEGGVVQVRDMSRVGANRFGQPLHVTG